MTINKSLKALYALSILSLSVNALGSNINNSSLNWQPCAPYANPAYQCAEVAVPLDYTHPNGNKINIKVMRAKALDHKHKLGVLFINQGGPWNDDVDGAITFLSAKDLPPYFKIVQNYLQKLHKYFDIMAFNPRGISPQPVTCTIPKLDTVMATTDLSTLNGITKYMQLAKNRVTLCRKQYKEHMPLMKHLGTANTVKDLELIRQRIGVDKINYYGDSYGTLLGAHYVSQYPEHVRAMVLDGNMYPDSSSLQKQWYPSYKAAQETLLRFFSECRKNPNCPISSNPSGIALKVLARARIHPIPSSAQVDNIPLTPAILLNTTFEAGGGLLAFVASWPTLAQGLADAYYKNDSTLLVNQFNQMNDYDAKKHTYANDGSLLSSVVCSDYGNHADSGQLLSKFIRSSSSYPVLGAFTPVPFQAICLNWPIPAQPLPRLGKRKDLPPVLIVNNINDPMTPYSAAKQMTKALSNSRLLTVNGAGHVALTNEGPAHCVKNYTYDYFVNLRLPPRGAICNDFANPF